MIILLIKAAVLLLHQQLSREDALPGKKTVSVFNLAGKVPKVAIVIDDLSPDREVPRKLLTINTSLTLAVLPHKTYSIWIAEEGYRKGRDFIAHIPPGGGDVYSARKGRNLYHG